MAILSAICMVLISQQVTVNGVLGLWALFSVFQNGQYASLSASIPDHVPVRQRATVAGWVPMPQALGLVIGVELVASVFTQANGRLHISRRGDAAVRLAVRILDRRSSAQQG
jgi:sugar phosphate permease